MKTKLEVRGLVKFIKNIKRTALAKLMEHCENISIKATDLAMSSKDNSDSMLGI